MRSYTFWPAAAAALLSGCGGDAGGRVPAAGRVTLDGAPVAGAYVTFTPDEGEPVQGGFGTTDAAGRFAIAYPATGPGLVPARYRVAVTPVPPAAGPDARPFDPARVAAAARFPAKYASATSTPLRVRVEPGGQPLTIELTSVPKK